MIQCTYSRLMEVRDRCQQQRNTFPLHQVDPGQLQPKCMVPYEDQDR